MNIAVATDPRQVVCEVAGVRWTLEVMPQLPGDLIEAACSEGLSIESGISGRDGARMVQIVALRSGRVVTAVDADGNPVTVNGKDATDAELWPVIVRAFPEIAAQAAILAVNAGNAVEGQRGNSDAAPA